MYFNIVQPPVCKGERGGLVVNAWTPDSEVGGSGPTRVKPCCVLELGTFTPQKVLVMHRKWWLRPNITEKLFTGTLRINQPTNQYDEASLCIILAGLAL